MPQDRGYAWVVCGTSFLAQMMIGGFMYTSGIYYIMFKNGIDASDSALSLITSLNVGIMFAVCPAVGMLSDRYGERSIAVLGSFLSTVGLAASAFTTQVYQLYIFYSVFAGVGMGMNYNPCISILSKYFHTHRRLACACAMCGLGAGSFIIPPLLKALEDHYGWRGAILLLAGINSHSMVLCCTFRPVEEQQEEEGADSEAAVEGVGKGGTEAHGGVLPLSGIVTDGTRSIALHPGIYKSCHSVNHYNSSSRSLYKNSADIKPLFISHIDMGAFYKSSSDVSSLYRSSSDTNQLNRSSNDVKRLYKSSNDVKYLPKSLSNLEICTEGPEVSDTFVERLSALFRITPFICMLLFTLIVQFTIAIVYTHFGNYVLTLGYSSGDVVGLYMAMGITSTLCRPVTGILVQATHANAAGVILLTNVVNGVLTVGLPLTRSLPLLYLYMVLFSLLITPYNVLSSSFVMESVPPTQASTGFGLLCFCCTPGTVMGAPLAAWLYDSTHIYDSSFYLAGGLMVAAGLTMSPPAYSVYKQRRAQAE